MGKREEESRKGEKSRESKGEKKGGEGSGKGGKERGRVGRKRSQGDKREPAMFFPIWIQCGIWVSTQPLSSFRPQITCFRRPLN
jgi:hypothetical protein